MKVFLWFAIILTFWMFITEDSSSEVICRLISGIATVIFIVIYIFLYGGK